MSPLKTVIKADTTSDREALFYRKTGSNRAFYGRNFNMFYEVNDLVRLFKKILLYVKFQSSLHQQKKARTLSPSLLIRSNDADLKNESIRGNG